MRISDSIITEVAVVSDPLKGCAFHWNVHVAAVGRVTSA